jgi:hypothetical protein
MSIRELPQHPAFWKVAFFVALVLLISAHKISLEAGIEV